MKTTRIEACARVEQSSIVAAACGGIDIGSLVGNTPALEGSSQGTTQWIAAAALLRASWMIVPWLSIGAEVGAFVPNERTSFTLSGPPRLVYRAPPVLFGGGAGLGVTARFR
ncbi:hypothetical protein AKJ09_01630 [Labilithrix luteola]|uniref:Uncharacterized protein n=1 Tax=Labilithrix luteola TaxID=1391654 RepID=A0A0K1PNJ3_9BACT|nr:hypothetical protein [Labilithrix luteola]AKU94966.1 hypothetical protein AKJ09_01630 [Labilithrix luteola]